MASKEKRPEAKNCYRETAITFAHISAGYITCRILEKRFETKITSYPQYLFWGVSGAVIPDLDYVWLYLFNPQFQDHHLYVTHFLSFWVTLLTISWLWMIVSKTSRIPLLFFIFSLNGLIHIMLDSVEGVMYWLAPFSYKGFSGMSILMNLAPKFIERFPDWHYVVETLIILWSNWLFYGRLRHKKELSGISSSEIHSPT